MEMPLNNEARAANVIRTRASYFGYSYPRMSVLQIVYLGSNWQRESSRNISDNSIFSIYKLNYVFNISQFRYFIEFFFYYLSPPSSLRSAGATRVPNNSIACIIFRWGNDSAFCIWIPLNDAKWCEKVILLIWKDMPPKSWCCCCCAIVIRGWFEPIPIRERIAWCSNNYQKNGNIIDSIMEEETLLITHQ